MFNAIIMSVFMCLILFGTVAFCYVLMLKLLLPKNNDNYYVFIQCDECSKDIRKQVYGTRLKFNLIGDEKCSKIVVLDAGISQEERENLIEICSDCNGIYLIPQESIKDFIDGRF